MPLFGAAYAAPNKGTTILYWFRSPKTLLNPPVNGSIQGLFKAFECFSSSFQSKFYFQGLFKTVLYIQVLSSLCEPCNIFQILYFKWIVCRQMINMKCQVFEHTLWFHMTGTPYLCSHPEAFKLCTWESKGCYFIRIICSEKIHIQQQALF